MASLRNVVASLAPNLTATNDGAYNTQGEANKMRQMMRTEEGRKKVAKANAMFSMIPKVNKNTCI